ncbi:DUF1801 domain-containing protein [Aquimarina gracilis]|uniref:DUF1801 domain-containing protein n=1 Tax=Aquimarina gracilis TaxID=874422 RepID=A0ABU5ZWN8_9FLAO|nr:DUF1801 domain-containing protein [Aquimarina gracilis]MEB3346300.1 DUF1801 domain-containing protein [Aquimarina gracilis]
MKLKTDSRVPKKFDEYPIEMKEKLINLRKLILETANTIPSILELEETLKWGEPSYLTKKGSTIRINAKASDSGPNQYAMYFQCTSKLVPTFRVIYKDAFSFEGNRAIVFNIDDEIPKEQLCHCVSLALTYHNVKHLPLLGLNKEVILKY